MTSLGGSTKPKVSCGARGVVAILATIALASEDEGLMPDLAPTSTKEKGLMKR